MSCEEEPPVHDYALLVNEFIQERNAAAGCAAAVALRAEQLRAIQKRLLVRYRDKNAVPLGALDLLLEAAYQQLQLATSAAQANEGALATAARRLATGSETLVQFVRFRCRLEPGAWRLVRSCLCADLPQLIGGGSNDASTIGWLETATSALEHLLSQTDAGQQQPPRQPLRRMEDSSQFVRALTTLCSRLAAGAKFPPALTAQTG
eukprot:TRINITY_DN4501_c1_g1_i1.p1 TRINITY_DN4501_c1_g1~~TRINITY_DN4501_c1_g1_i1.p1  ORF type:complete len:206 (+),score=84.42 TRINITY_DN4501_c1_g1_i1:291-908(+)